MASSPMFFKRPGASAHSALISPKPLTHMPHPRFSHMLSSAAALDAVETTALPSARRIASSTVTAAMSATQDRPVATQVVGDPSTPRVVEAAANGTMATMTTSVSDPELSRMASASPSTALSCESPDELIGGDKRVLVAVAVTEAVPVSTSATDLQPRKQARRSRVAASIPATAESLAAATDAVSLEKITKAAVRLVTEEFESEMASLQDELTSARLQVSESNAALAAKTSECEQWRDATFRAVQMAQHAVTSSQQAEDTLSSASTTPSGRSAGSPTQDRDEVVPALQLRLAAASAALSDTETRLEAAQASATALRTELTDAKAEVLAMAGTAAATREEARLSVEAAQAAAAAESHRMQSRIGALESDAAEQRKTGVALDAELRQAINERDSLRAERDALAARVSTVEAALADSKVQANDLEARRVNAESLLAHAMARVTHAESSLVASEGRANAAAAQIAALEAQLERARDGIEQTARGAEEVRARLELALAAKRVASQEEIDSAVQALRARVSDLEAALSDANEHAARESATEAQLLQRLEAEQAAHRDALERCDSVVRQLETALSDANERVARESATEAQLLQRLEAEQAAHCDALERRDSVVRQLETALSDANERVARESATEAQLLQRLEAEQAAHRDALERRDSVVSELEAKWQSLEGKLKLVADQGTRSVDAVTEHQRSAIERAELRAALLEAQLAEHRAASAASVTVERNAFDDRVALEAALRESEEARQRDAAAFAAKEVARDADSASQGAKEASKAAARISLLEAQIEEAAEREQALERRLAKALAAFEDTASADLASAAAAASSAAAAPAPVAEVIPEAVEQKPVAERVATAPPPLERMPSVAKLPEDVGFLDAKAREAAAAKARAELAAEIKRKRLQTAKNRVFAMVGVVAVFIIVALANGHYAAAK